MWTKVSRYLQSPNFFIYLFIFHLGRYQAQQIWKQKWKHPNRRQFIWDIRINMMEWKFPILLNNIQSLQKEASIGIAKRRWAQDQCKTEENIINEDHQNLIVDMREK